METTYPYPLGELIEYAEHCALRYYEQGDSPLSDDEFDALQQQIVALCKKHRINPNDIRVVSGVGYSRESLLTKHTVRMYSLDNVYNSDDLRKFLMRVYQSTREYQDSETVSYGLEYKVDGMALELTYRFGRLVSAITRGDGKRGENILANVLHVKSIPVKLKDCELPLLVVHGELYVRKSEFERYKQSPDSDLLNPPQNCRSLVLTIRNQHFPDSGLQLSFNPHEIAACAFDIHDTTCINLIPEELYSDSMSTRLDGLRRLGFERIPPLSPPIPADRVDELSLVIDRHHLNTAEQRNTWDFDIPIDGLVISVDQIEYREQIGYTSRVPKWAIAYKFPALGVDTTVQGVDWQLTMNGNLIPVLKVTPVYCGGVTISSVSMHSHSSFVAKQLHHRDRILVLRKADVTPFVGEVYAQDRISDTNVITVPSHCPSCGGLLRVVSVHLKCENHEACTDQIIARLIRFVGGSGMNIRGFGKYGVSALYKQGKLKTPVDVYKLHTGRHNGSKVWQALLRQIEASKSRDFLIVLKALNVPKPKGGYGKIVKTYRNLNEWIDHVVDHKAEHEEHIYDYVLDQYPMLKELFSLGVGHVNQSYVVLEESFDE